MREMVNVTISLSKENKKKLDDLAKVENRKKSNQIVHMMDFYIKHKDKVK